jgi:hypothetical protein
MTYNAKTPIPGDSIFALKHMRAWETIYTKGSSENWVEEGDFGLVVQSCAEGNNKIKLQLFINGKYLVFSCRADALHLNWYV